MKHFRSNQSGSVVVLTLWSVIFLGLLAMAVAANVAAHLRVAGDLKWGSRSRDVGMRALADAIDVLASDSSDSYDALHESWANNNSRFSNVPYGDGSYSVVSGATNSEAGSAEKKYGLTDEGGKINLNRASPELLSSLFQIAGVTKTAADEMGTFIVDWRDADLSQAGNPLGSEACATLSLPSQCKNAGFEALEELWWMPGMTPSVYNTIRPALTLYGGSAVNANTAGSPALQAVGLSSTGADLFVSWRSTPGNFFQDNSDIIARASQTGMSEEDQTKLKTAAASGILGTRSDAFRAETEVRFGGRTRKGAAFVVDRLGNILWWSE